MANALLSQVARETGPERSKDKVEVEAPGKVAAALKRWRAARAKVDEGEAERRVAQAEIFPFAEKARLEASRGSGKLVDSIRLIAGEDRLLYGTRCAYSAVDVALDGGDTLKALGKLFGAKQTPVLFRQVQEVELATSALGDESFVAELLALIDRRVKEQGGKRTDYLKVKEGIKPTEEYHLRRSLDPKFAKQAEDAESHGLVRPHAAYLRIPTKKDEEE